MAAVAYSLFSSKLQHGHGATFSRGTSTRRGVQDESAMIMAMDGDKLPLFLKLRYDYRGLPFAMNPL
jgi:hypothetical protein